MTVGSSISYEFAPLLELEDCEDSPSDDSPFDDSPSDDSLDEELAADEIALATRPNVSKDSSN